MDANLVGKPIGVKQVIVRSAPAGAGQSGVEMGVVVLTGDIIDLVRRAPRRAVLRAFRSCATYSPKQLRGAR